MTTHEAAIIDVSDSHSPAGNGTVIDTPRKRGIWTFAPPHFTEEEWSTNRCLPPVSELEPCGRDDTVPV